MINLNNCIMVEYDYETGELDLEEVTHDQLYEYKYKTRW